MFRRLYLLLLIVSPGFVEAAVTINEVAWMGDTASANHEWVELYNSGEAAVSLEGWTLSDGLNLAVTLTGSITPGEYAVLERTSEESAVGTAFLIYTGAIINTGATLTLRDAGGTIQDQVPGGEEWQNIGGDNTTKETAQYTSGGWITAPGTPGRANATVGSVPEEEDDDSVTTAKPTSRQVTENRSSNAPVLVRTTKSGLSTTVTGPTQTYVNQPVSFTLEAAGAGATIISSLKNVWNFGDTYTASGTSVTHTYEYPGTYVVTVRSIYAKHDVTTRHQVTVLPVRVSLGRTTQGDIILNNDAPYEIDISGFVVKGTAELVIPPGTIMLERSTITIPKARVEKGGVNHHITIYDAARRLVTSTATAVTSPRAVVSQLQESTVSASPEQPSIVSLARDKVVVTPEKPIPSLLAAPIAYAETAATPVVPEAPSTDTSPQTPLRWPYVALVVVIGGALLVIFRTESTTLDRDSAAS